MAKYVESSSYDRYDVSYGVPISGYDAISVLSGQTSGKFYYLSRQRLRNSSSMLLVADSGSKNRKIEGKYAPNASIYMFSFGAQLVKAIHQNRFNVGFFDGHAVTISIAEYFKQNLEQKSFNPKSCLPGRTFGAYTENDVLVTSSAL